MPIPDKILSSEKTVMGFDQYHEPPEELSQEVRTFARMIQSLIEEAEAIGWYEQRLAVEKNAAAKKIMQHTQKEEFIHFAMDLEFLLRQKKTWKTIMKNVLFKPGDIVKNGEKAEEEADWAFSMNELIIWPAIWLNQLKDCMKEDKNKIPAGEEKRPGTAAPDEETLNSSDPQENMRGPVSSSTRQTGKAFETGESKEDADRRRDANLW